MLPVLKIGQKPCVLISPQLSHISNSSKNHFTL